ncbi:hypothetical protein AVEN_164593-1 [Araneus ventricosus]|uniref:Uncharacterized protein n=1 Tax=Araneus ventricosus TaxID=182803 RepID=A0A4Y2B548_ARAVE|nr:hypothetical protein AVEN_164593-1 [Araneus ventricosus]
MNLCKHQYTTKNPNKCSIIIQTVLNQLQRIFDLRTRCYCTNITKSEEQKGGGADQKQQRPGKEKKKEKVWKTIVSLLNQPTVTRGGKSKNKHSKTTAVFQKRGIYESNEKEVSSVGNSVPLQLRAVCDCTTMRIF